MRIWAFSAAAGAMLAMSGCSKPPSEFGQATEDFVYSSLALSPVSATQAGYHEHQGVALDGEMDDYSPQALARQRSFYLGFRGRLAEFPAGSLTAEENADLRIIQDQISLALLELDTIQSYRHNPTQYVELVGNALFSPYMLDYAPKERRFSDIIARLRKIPALMEQAKGNLVDSPEAWNRVAREENEGNIALIDATLRKAAPKDLQSDYDAAAGPALVALRGFSRSEERRVGKE